jgi:TPR repeat protein
LCQVIVILYHMLLLKESVVTFFQKYPQLEEYRELFSQFFVEEVGVVIPDQVELGQWLKERTGIVREDHLRLLHDVLHKEIKSESSNTALVESKYFLPYETNLHLSKIHDLIQESIEETLLNSCNSKLRELLDEALKGETSALVKLGTVFRDGEKERKDNIAFSLIPQNCGFAVRYYLLAACKELAEEKELYTLDELFAKEINYEEETVGLTVDSFSISSTPGSENTEHENRLSCLKKPGEALFWLARCYYRSEGVSNDLSAAVYYYEASVNRGSADAMNNLGCCYHCGEGVDKSLVKAFQLYYLGYKNAIPSDYAAYNIAACYENGTYVAKDILKAAFYYRKSADLGHSGGFYKVGSYYMKGLGGIEKNFQEGVRYYHLAVEKDNSDAMNSLGIAYLDGLGVDKDPQKAITYYKMGTEKGNGYAAFNLATCYRYGKGVPVDMKEAVRFYRISAEKGNVDAMNSIGICYANGLGMNIRKNIEEAIVWYDKAIEKGSGDAAFNRAEVYRKGYGIRPDEKRNISEAIRLYRFGITKGSKDSYSGLGLCYLQGVGVEQDYKEGIRLLQEAINKGEIYSMFYLGDCYLKGKGVEIDLEKAMSFYEMAAKEEFAISKQRMKDLTKFKS